MSRINFNSILVMKKYIPSVAKRLICILIVLMVGLTTAEAQEKGDDSDLFTPEIEEQAAKLLQKMTLEEKVGQMTQITLDVVGQGDSRYSSNFPFALDQQALEKAVVDHHVGSILNTASNRALTRETWYDVISQIQAMATEAQLGRRFPIIYGHRFHSWSYLYRRCYHVSTAN
ncbi:MAG: hypothetical protein U5J63_13825 [Fodinibius sp.]|nr:hypothetical protein [Fodinibius sp.]